VLSAERAQPTPAARRLTRMSSETRVLVVMARD
jgi:hypothetical protein